MKLIVAIGKDGAIGKGGNLIWRLPDDLRRFKAITIGHPVIMGRKTWESLPKKPLPGRRNIILTRNKDFKAEGAEIVSSPEEALAMTVGENPFIIGGAEIYNTFLPYVTEMHLTLVDEECRDADAFLYLNLSDGWRLSEDSGPLETDGGIRYRYLTYNKEG